MAGQDLQISFKPVCSNIFITGMDWWVLKYQAGPSSGHQEDCDLVFPTMAGGRACGPCPIREETLLQVCWVEVRADMRSLKFTIAFLLAADLSEQKKEDPTCPRAPFIWLQLEWKSSWDDLGFSFLFTNKLLPSVSLNDKGEYTKNLHDFQVRKSIQFVEDSLPHSLNT